MSECGNFRANGPAWFRGAKISQTSRPKQRRACTPAVTAASKTRVQSVGDQKCASHGRRVCLGRGRVWVSSVRHTLLQSPSSLERGRPSTRAWTARSLSTAVPGYCKSTSSAGAPAIVPSGAEGEAATREKRQADVAADLADVCTVRRRYCAVRKTSIGSSTVFVLSERSIRGAWSILRTTW